MAKKPLRIADALGFGSSAKPYVSPYLREVSKIKPGQKLPGTITRAPQPSAATELAQLLTPNTRFGNELAAKIAPAVEMSPLGVLTGLVDARRAYQAGNVGNAASTGILAALGAIPVGKGAKAATLFDTVRDAGMGQVFRRTPEGAYITVMENSKYAPRPNSVTDFVVPEELRGKGIGGKMLDEIFGIYGPETISAAASSIPSVKAFYKRGLRPGGNPNATLDDAIKIMKEDSSVTMIKPKSEGIIAYHGSPHSFDRFDISKMGAGQGAQAYGRGLYFAEAEDVAKKYRDDLTGAINSSANTGIRQTGSIDAAIKRAKDRISSYSKMDDPRAKGLLEINRKELAQLEKMKAGGGDLKGSMYQVKINADPSQFMDWDKPLSEQPQTVLNALKPFIDERVSGFQNAAMQAKKIAEEQGLPSFETKSVDEIMSGLLGGDIMGYAQLKKMPSVEKTLAESGIPGIRYLDQGSRGAGTGSRNYVVFDDALIEILKKYGIAIPALAGGGLLATQPQQDGGL